MVRIGYTIFPEALTIQALDPPHVDGVFTEFQAPGSQRHNVLGVEEALGEGQLVYVVEGDPLAVELGLVRAQRLTL